MWQILCAVIDDEINTPEQGDALLAEEAKEYADVLKITEADARAQLLVQIETAAATICTIPDAKKLRSVYR